MRHANSILIAILALLALSAIAWRIASRDRDTKAPERVRIDPVPVAKPAPVTSPPIAPVTKPEPDAKPAEPAVTKPPPPPVPIAPPSPVAARLDTLRREVKSIRLQFTPGPQRRRAVEIACRARSRELLAYLKENPDAVDAFWKGILDETDEEIQVGMAKLIPGIGDSLEPELLKQAKSTDERLRRVALAALGSPEDLVAFSFLDEAARHSPSADTRRVAIESLGKYPPRSDAWDGSGTIATTLQTVLERDPDLAVRESALTALRSHISTEAYRDYVRKLAAREPDPLFRARLLAQTYQNERDESPPPPLPE
jgi:hypothetical protein